MRFKVYLLRKAGQRLRWRDVLNGSSHLGELIMHGIDVNGERYQVLTVRPADPMVVSPIPEVYEPVLFAFTTLAFRLRGFERVERLESSFAVVQEWHCELPGSQARNYYI